MIPKVYFSKIVNSEPKTISEQTKELLKVTTAEENISWSKELPIKIHPGAIGNTTYLSTAILDDVIAYLKSLSVNPHFIETCMSSEDSSGKESEFVTHGFTQIPHVIADGKNGDEHVQVSVEGSKHFTTCLIAKKLAEAEQVLVVSHFKGHGMAGFGGAIKMLGIGFASGQGKTIVHSVADNVITAEAIDWDHAKNSANVDESGILDWNPEVVSTGSLFRERVAAYATAAAKGKGFVYLNIAMNMSQDCDCIGEEMKPIYQDLGIFVSTDPVAIDKAVFDMLKDREGKTPFAGSEIFATAEKLGLGSIEYNLVEV